MTLREHSRCDPGLGCQSWGSRGRWGSRVSLPGCVALIAAALLPAAVRLPAQQDPLAALDERLGSGELQLEFEREHGRGYLDAVLQALDIPASSQVLVFSKTSAQFRLIHPGSPRAVYFNDDVYVGWVRGGPILELSAADPQGAGVFYTLDQDPTKPPRLAADRGQCLQCHESARTQSIPGHLVRSVFPTADGQPLFSAGTTNVDQTTPMEQRWGGWYVSGSMGGAHRGNSIFASMENVQAYERAPAALDVDFTSRFSVDHYLSPHSDPVALLLLTHQVQMHNVIARAGVEARRALAYQREMTEQFGEASTSLLDSVKRRIERPAEEIVRHLLFREEAELPGAIEPASSFAEEFQQRGPFDRQGRSLRQLDLEKRMLRYPCSYLVYSDAFKALPEPTLAYVFRRLDEILSGDDKSKYFSHLSDFDRTAIAQILRETDVLPKP